MNKKPVYIVDIQGARAFVGHASTPRGATVVARKYRKKACAALATEVGFTSLVTDLNT